MNSKTKEWLMQYPRFRECSIQTFNDQDKNDKTRSRILPMTDENLEKCEKLQAKFPYGVYFSVNPMESGKRNADSVKAIQTWICDIDTGTKEEQLELINKAPLKPTFVVESVHGFHLYYFADRELTREEYENGNRGLRNYYNGDAKVCRDVARVLRIPGFYHMKGEPVMVEWREDLSGGELFSVDDMERGFPNQTETTPGIEKQREYQNKFLNEDDNFRTKAGELNSKMMLEEFSGTGWVSGDTITFKRNTSGTEQIYVNGKSTGCRIDKNLMIGSGDKGGPTWIQWLKRYGNVDRKELAKELKRKHPELEEKKTIQKIDVAKMLSRSDITTKLERPDFTRGEKGLDDNIGKLFKGQLVILSGETGAGKTTFATFMARKNPNSCYFVLEDNMENIAKRYAIRRAGITREELNNGTRGEDKLKKFEGALNRFMKQEINFIDIGKKIDVGSLIEAMRELKAKGYSMFFIDNLGFVLGEGRGETEQTADVSSKLLSFCLNENVCIVLLHHFKKGEKDAPRDISHLRGSGKLGDDAFLVANYMRVGKGTVLRILKDRNRGELKDYSMTYDRGEFTYEGTEDW